MGKAQVKFVILVDTQDLLNEQVTRLTGMGHVIIPAPMHDVYLDRMTLSKKAYVDAALKGARARKKGEKNDPLS